MSHPNEDVLGNAYVAFVRGDLEGYLCYCSNKIVFQFPGRNSVAGTYTREQFVPFINRVMELSAAREDR
jgi:ketosteroid isomerase-like protein